MIRVFSFFLLFCFLATTAIPVFAQNDEDDRIFDEVRRRLANDPDVKGGAFEVDVQDGIVTVKGVVEKLKFRQKAERLVRRVKGVKSVNNQITVKDSRYPQ